MGLFGFLRRRRDRESAIPGAEAADAGTFSVAPPSQQAGALRSGGSTPPVVSQSSQVIDATNVSGLRDDMLAILKRHGIDPMGGQMTAINATDIPGLTEEIQSTLAGHGINVAAMGWSPQGVPGLMQMDEPPHGADPAERIHKLEQLRDSGLITPAEFDQQRSRILGEV